MPREKGAHAIHWKSLGEPPFYFPAVFSDMQKILSCADNHVVRDLILKKAWQQSSGILKD